jgi:hypothetical protein
LCIRIKKKKNVGCIEKEDEIGIQLTVVMEKIEKVIKE